MKRGEIYYIYPRATTGAEIAKGRPGVIVSNDLLNKSRVVEVVFLTTHPKPDLPTHAAINSASRPSTAVCEQINTVAIERIGDKMGECTPEEMAAIDRALLASLGITRTAHYDRPSSSALVERLTAERDIYRKLTQDLINKAVL